MPEKNFKEITNDFFSKKISQRQFITFIKLSKELQQSLKKETCFLDPYNEDIDISERIYYIINKKTTAELCPYCGKLKKFSGRINEGYYPTCCSKECKSKLKSSQMISANIKGHLNLFEEYKKWEADLVDINDDIIKKEFFFKKKGLKTELIDKIKSKKLINYLNNRFKDSNSLSETLYRINLNIENKPKCPVCGKPVTFIGKPYHLFSTYCSTSCAGNDPDVINKKQTADRKRNGGKLGWVLSNSSKEKIEKRKNTLNEKYGTTSLYKVPGIKEKIRNTNIRKFGVPSVMLNQDIKEKQINSMIKSLKQGTSKPEEDLYKILKGKYILTKHHYRNIEYPYNCDFYIPEKNLYIEYQGSQYHHGHPFNPNNQDDIKEKISLERHASSFARKNQYQCMLAVWTKSDPEKRKTAHENGLNFKEIWNLKNIDKELEDIDGFPDICPFHLNYTIEELKKEFEYYKNAPGNISALPNKNKIVKLFQQDVFYKNEFQLLKDENILRKINENRKKYIGKEINELSSDNVLNALKVSGIYYGYSHFSPLWLKWFTEKYNITSLYDPCGGWGHHLLGCLNLKKYIYNDFNIHIKENVDRIISNFQIENVETHCNDAALWSPDENVDAWFMCPPYFNIEIYDKKFKCIEDYEDFLNRIFKKWEISNSKIFGLIIREDFVKLIHFKFMEKYKIGSYNENSHFIRSLNIEKKHEYLYIFKKL